MEYNSENTKNYYECSDSLCNVNDKHAQSEFDNFKQVRKEAGDYQIPLDEDSNHEEQREGFMVSTTDKSVRKIRSLQVVYDSSNVSFLACEPHSRYSQRSSEEGYE